MRISMAYSEAFMHTPLIALGHLHARSYPTYLGPPAGAMRCDVLHRRSFYPLPSLLMLTDSRLPLLSLAHTVLRVADAFRMICSALVVVMFVRFYIISSIPLVQYICAKARERCEYD